MNLEDGISKKQWIEVVQFINFRWDNAKLDDAKVKELYPDFAQFPEEVVWKSMNMYYEHGNRFFNVVEFRRRGILKRLFVTPIKPIDFVSAIVVARMIIVLGQLTAIFGFALFILDANIVGSILYLYL